MPNDEQRQIMVPTDDIAPFVTITKDMLTSVNEKTVKNQLRSDVVGRDDHGSDIVGRYALEQLKASHVVHEEQLGPELPKGSLVNSRVTTVVVATDGMVRSLQPGMRFTLLLAPPDLAKEALVLPSTLALDARTRSDNETILVVAIDAEDVNKFAQYAGASTAIIAR